MKRTFIAVRIVAGEKLLTALSHIRSELAGERIKWEETGKIHLTLAFIGDTSEGTILEIGDMLGNICGTAKSFTFDISGIGLFKSIHDPRVIWVGIEEHEALSALRNSVIAGLDALGIAVELRPFRPHLTVGRIKSFVNRNALEAVIDKYKDVRFQKTIVREVIYYESILRPEGSLYLPIRKCTMDN